MGKLVFICLVAVVVLMFLCGTTVGKRLRLRASGTADELISKDASTPEGAKAYYNTAISKKEEDYQTAHAIYVQMLGKIDGYETQLRALKKEDMQLSLNINSCIEKNDDEAAKVYLVKQQEISDRIDIIKEAIAELKNNAALQDETLKALFDEM